MNIASIEQLKEYRKNKLKFANQFKADKLTIQKCVDEFIAISVLHDGKLIAEDVILYINENSTCILANLFLLMPAETEEDKIKIIENIINQMSLLIGSDNYVYIIQTEGINNG